MSKSGQSHFSKLETKITLALFLLNFITGLLFINEGLFHFDSVVLAQAVEKTYSTGILQPAVKGRYGSVIINAILHLPFYMVGKNADFTVRFSSVLFHSLSIAVVFLFIKELFNNYIQAFFSSLLLSFTPFYFSANTYGKEHGLSIFVVILSFYFLTLGLNKKSLILLAISSFAFVFSFTIRESLLAAIPLYFLLYLGPKISICPFRISFPSERFNPKIILSVTLPFIVVFCISYFVYLKYELYRALIIRDNTSAYFLGLFSPVFRFALHDLFISIPPVLFIFLIIGIIRMYFNFKKDLFLWLFFFIWLMSIFYFGNTNSYVARYLDIPIIAVYVFASYALSELYKTYKIAVLSITIYFVLSMFIFMVPMLEFRHRYNGTKQFALYVKEKTKDNAIVIAMDDGPFIEYYGHRRTLCHPIGDKLKINNLVRDINKYLKKEVPVYLIESALAYDPGMLFKNALFGNFNVSIVGEKLTEDYHRPDAGLRFYYEKLFKIEPK